MPPDTWQIVQQTDKGDYSASSRLLRPLHASVPISTPLPRHLSFHRKFADEDMEENYLMPRDVCEMQRRPLKESDRCLHIAPTTSVHPPESDEALVEGRLRRLIPKTHLGVNRPEDYKKVYTSSTQTSSLAC